MGCVFVFVLIAIIIDQRNVCSLWGRSALVPTNLQLSSLNLSSLDSPSPSLSIFRLLLRSVAAPSASVCSRMLSSHLNGASGVQFRMEIINWHFRFHLSLLLRFQFFPSRGPRAFRPPISSSRCRHHSFQFTNLNWKMTTVMTMPRSRAAGEENDLVF